MAQKQALKQTQLDRRRQRRKGKTGAGEAAGAASGDSGAEAEAAAADGGSAAAEGAAAARAEPGLPGGAPSAVSTTAAADCTSVASELAAPPPPQQLPVLSGTPGLSASPLPEEQPGDSDDSTAATCTVETFGDSAATPTDSAASTETGGGYAADVASSAESPMGGGLQQQHSGNAPVTGLTGTYVSRNADSLSLGGLRPQPAGVPGGVPNEGAVRAPRVRFQEEQSTRASGAEAMRRLSDQLHMARLAPEDAKSGTLSGRLSLAPSALAARPGLSRGSTLGAVAGVALEDRADDGAEEGSSGVEEIAETDPGQGGGLAGGFRDSTTNSSASEATSSAATFTATNSSGGSCVSAETAQHAPARSAPPPMPRVAEDREEKQHAVEEQVLRAAQGAQQRPAGRLGSPEPEVAAGITDPCGAHVDVGRQDAGKGEDALYADLDALQEEAASVGLRDVSDSEADAASLDRQLQQSGQPARPPNAPAAGVGITCMHALLHGVPFPPALCRRLAYAYSGSHDVLCPVLCRAYAHGA